MPIYYQAKASASMNADFFANKIIQNIIRKTRIKIKQKKMVYQEIAFWTHFLLCMPMVHTFNHFMQRLTPLTFPLFVRRGARSISGSEYSSSRRYQGQQMDRWAEFFIYALYMDVKHKPGDKSATGSWFPNWLLVKPIFHFENMLI